jgi:hypothetical protein
MKAIVNVDPETAKNIDPISMIISKFKQWEIQILFHLIINHKIIPKVYDVCSKFWAQLQEWLLMQLSLNR